LFISFATGFVFMVALALFLLDLFLGFGNAKEGFQGGAAIAEEFNG